MRNISKKIVSSVIAFCAPPVLLIGVPLIVSLIIAGMMPARAQVPTNGARQSGTIVPNNTTGVNLKASQGIVIDVVVSSISATPAYLKFYDKATQPVCGTDVPVKRVLIPGSTAGLTTAVPFPVGVRFTLGIGYCVTTGIADNDTTAPAASTFLVNIDWN